METDFSFLKGLNPTRQNDCTKELWKLAKSQRKWRNITLFQIMCWAAAGIWKLQNFLNTDVLKVFQIRIFKYWLRSFFSSKSWACSICSMLYWCNFQIICFHSLSCSDWLPYSLFLQLDIYLQIYYPHIDIYFCDLCWFYFIFYPTRIEMKITIFNNIKWWFCCGITKC